MTEKTSMLFTDSVNLSLKLNILDCIVLAGTKHTETESYISLNERTMGKYDKLLHKVLSGTSDSNIQFSELCQLLFRLDFKERIKGDHHIFTKQDIDEIINIQPKEGKAKLYQVKQVRNLILKYKLGDITNE